MTAPIGLHIATKGAKHIDPDFPPEYLGEFECAVRGGCAAFADWNHRTIYIVRMPFVFRECRTIGGWMLDRPTERQSIAALVKTLTHETLHIAFGNEDGFKLDRMEREDYFPLSGYREARA